MVTIPNGDSDELVISLILLRLGVGALQRLLEALQCLLQFKADVYTLLGIWLPLGSCS